MTDTKQRVAVPHGFVRIGSVLVKISKIIFVESRSTNFKSQIWLATQQYKSELLTLETSFTVDEVQQLIHEAQTGTPHDGPYR